MIQSAEGIVEYCRFLLPGIWNERSNGNQARGRQNNRRTRQRVNLNDIPPLKEMKLDALGFLEQCRWLLPRVQLKRQTRGRQSGGRQQNRRTNAA